jgi:hypothetical protein
VANEKTTFADAFAMADDVLRAGVSCITDLMVKEGRQGFERPVKIQPRPLTGGPNTGPRSSARPSSATNEQATHHR